MTPAETALWKVLRRNGQKGFYFRGQHPIGRFVVDFCCASRKLCIEVDGDVHNEQRERDAERTAHLEAEGYRVLRFRNEDVLGAIHLVVGEIRAALHDLPPSPAADLPRPARREAGPGLLNLPPPDSWG